jgi:hypothetical protein
MAAKRKTNRREAQLAFDALSIEGGLLSPEWLSKVAQLQAGMQVEADYRIHKGLNLRDEIGRYWRIAQAHWADFKSGRDAKANPKAVSERFVPALLRDALGFTALASVEPVVLQERAYPIGHATLGGGVPVVIAPAASGLDSLASAFSDGSRKRSSFGLAQEYLNAQEGALWGIASDGASLRIVRDNASLTRPAWIEADLERIFTEERYSDFAALWLLCHETRFGREGQPVRECALEAWRSAGREEGTRAREHLRRGVEDALVAFGQGFLSHVGNTALRTDLQNGTLPVKDYFNQLLRLVYRLIFLLTVEERGLLHPDGTNDTAKELYATGYGIRRLRERAVKRSAHDRFSDLWEGTKVGCRGLAAGEPRLGLPALAGIFAANQCPGLDAAKLENRALLLAVFKLAWLREAGSLSRVNWRDMGPEELGSVYESLLELVPQITKDGRQFGFATGGATKGNARKTTGSYYTPDSLVQVLLDSALEPVVKDTIAKHSENPVEGLLGLSIVDPACGSGHFLLAAARRLASHVARLSAKGTPSAAEYRHALRQVVGRCIYGVDLNPMAVELCKVSLWMEAVEPGLPLTFLNSHIQHGNALLGTTPELMAKGIPDAAWEPIAGDDKKTASALKKRNKKAAEGQRSLDTLWSKPSDAEAQAVARAVAELEAASDANPEALAKKESKWDGILSSAEYRHQKLIADAWCAAFVWPKQSHELAEVAPTNELWRQLRDGQGQPPALTTKTVGELAEQYRFFHWNLQFPQVFAKGGFDVVLGNPPWGHVELRSREFFSVLLPEITAARTDAVRKRAIGQLRDTNPALYEAYLEAVRSTAGELSLLANSKRFPGFEGGRINTYALFAELAWRSLGKRGRAGVIVPSGIATDETSQGLFVELVRSGSLRQFLDFQSGPGLFGDVGHARFKFCLLTLATSQSSGAGAEFAFFLRDVAEVGDPARRFRLTPADMELVNPNTKTCPIFRTKRDAEITQAIYRHVPVLIRDGDPVDSPWGLTLRQNFFSMSTDSDLFVSMSQLVGGSWTRRGSEFVDRSKRMLPLMEAKMIHLFNARFGDYADRAEASESTALPSVTDANLANPHYATQARFWIDAEHVVSRMRGQWTHGWMMGVRRISRSTDVRTLISAVVPLSGALDSFSLLLANRDPAWALVCAFNSFVLDFVTRQKVGGADLRAHVVKQLPVPPPATYDKPTPWLPMEKLETWLLPRVLELTYTAWDLEAFAHDVGYDGPPFRWDPDRRFLLRCELDAAFLHLYALSRDDTDYVMDTFPIVRRNDEKAHGEYRTKRVILEIYDALAEATRTGKPYQTRLDPPPADPRVAHLQSTRPAWAKEGASS